MDGVSTGRRLKAARTLANVTVPQLAKRLSLPGLSAGTLGAIERGERDLRPQEVAPLADELGIPRTFFTGAAVFSDGESQLDRIEAQVANERSERERLADQLAADREDREGSVAEIKALLRTQNENLQRQTEILAELKALLATQQAAARHLEKMTEEAVKALPAPPARRVARKAPTGTSPGS